MLHVKSRAPVIATLPDPPEWGKEAEESVPETSHFGALGDVVVIELDELVQPLRKRTSPAVGERNRTAARKRKRPANRIQPSRPLNRRYRSTRIDPRSPSVT
jgi:hypothetical protein